MQPSGYQIQLSLDATILYRGFLFLEFREDLFRGVVNQTSY